MDGVYTLSGGRAEMNRSSRPLALDSAARTPELALAARAAGIDVFDRPSLGANADLAGVYRNRLAGISHKLLEFRSVPF